MDPLSSVAVGALAGEGAKTTGGVLTRLLGPAADLYGEQFAQFILDRREKQARRILEKTDAKAVGREGFVPPRVAYRVLDEGTLSDDEVMAEYLSGVLAGSLSPNGRDDRAIVWVHLIGQMSSMLLRAHYLLYREWTDLLQDTDVRLTTDAGRMQAQLELDALEYVSVLEHPKPDDARDWLDAGTALQHTMYGLNRVGLIDGFSFGPGADRKPEPSRHELDLTVMPTVAGVELWHWAGGRPWLSAGSFTRYPLTIDLDPPLPRLESASLAKLSP